MKKYCLLAVVCFVLGMTSHRIYRYYIVHRCDNPYREVCVKSHLKQQLIYWPQTVGKTTRILPKVVYISECDEYKKVLKKECLNER